MVGSVITVPLEFASSDGKSVIKAKVWTAPELSDGTGESACKPKGVVQLIHGMAEYIDRYDEFAKYLVKRGFVVCGEDYIGHGDTVTDPSDFGHMPARGGKDILLQDEHMLRRMVSGLYPGVPYAIYGHSMGSFIARSYIARYGDGLAGCVLSGTGAVPPAFSKLGHAAACALAAVHGERYRSKFIDSLGVGAYSKQIPNARTNMDWLSTDDAVVNAYIADEKCGFMFTVGGYATLLGLISEVTTPECARRVPKELPVLLVAGDGDPVGDMGKGVKATERLLRDAGVRDVVCKLYPGMRHEIINEIGREQVYDDVATWLEERMGSKPAPALGRRASL